MGWPVARTRCSAVECQKSTGSLHYHFFLFVQRLHQFATLKEIAELLETKLVEAWELKDFLANICCESYTDVEAFRQQRDSLEANFPAYSEASECQKGLQWGDLKLGRLPAFLYEDAGVSGGTADLSRIAASSPVTCEVDDLIDAAKYKSLFGKAF